MAKAFVILLSILGFVAYVLYQISNQKVALQPITNPLPQIQTSEVPLEEVKTAFLNYYSACIDALSANDCKAINPSTLAACKQASAESDLLVKELSLKQSIAGSLAALAGANAELQSYIGKCETYRHYKKTEMQTESEFKKSMELRIYNATKDWERRQAQYLQQLEQMKVQLKQEFAHMSVSSAPKTDPFVKTVLSISTQEQRNKWIRDRKKG